VVPPEQVVARIGSRSKQGYSLVERARQACVVVSTHKLVPTQPPQLVAAVVLVLAAMVSNVKINLSVVAQATISGTIPQIRRLYAALYSYFDLLLPPEAMANLPVSLAQLPPELVTVSVSSKTKSKTKAVAAKSKTEKKKSVVEGSSSYATTTNTVEASAEEAAEAMTILKAKDESKPRTRSNSVVSVGGGEEQQHEMWEVVMPLAPGLLSKSKKKKKKSKKAKQEQELEHADGSNSNNNTDVAPGIRSSSSSSSSSREGVNKGVAAAVGAESPPFLSAEQQKQHDLSPVTAGGSAGKRAACSQQLPPSKALRVAAGVTSSTTTTASATGGVELPPRASSTPSPSGSSMSVSGTNASTSASASASAAAYLRSKQSMDRLLGKGKGGMSSKLAAIAAVSGSKHGSPLFLTRR
jgi:hypothetical protein